MCIKLVLGQHVKSTTTTKKSTILNNSNKKEQQQNRKCDVINRGFSGYNTRFCKLILPKLITASDSPNMQLVTIFLGANDSVDSVKCTKQHVPLEEYTQNLLDMVEYLQVKTCLTHYENTPMQYTENFLVVKMKNSTGKNLIFFLFLLKT